MVMKLTEAKLRKYIEYIRREVGNLEVMAAHIEKEEKQGKNVLGITAMLRSRVAAIYGQITNLERAI